MATSLPRRVVVAPMLLALAVACTGQDPAIDEAPVAGDTPTAPTPTPTPPAGSPTTTAEVSPSPTAVTPTSTSTPSAAPTPVPTPTALTPADDAAGVGANARALLRRDRPGLVLEVDVQQGVEVDQEALDHLVTVLGRVLDKPDGIVFEGGTTFADDRTVWTADDLRRAAATHRSTATTTDRVSVHVLYVAGSHAEDGDQTNAIGLATSASTVAVFPHRWQGVVSLLGSDTAVERAVLVHELGHLLSLVNLGYRSDVDHEDPDHPGHSNSTASVMYHAIESTLIGQAFDGPPPAVFDEADRADLEGLRTGRL